MTVESVTTGGQGRFATTTASVVTPTRALTGPVFYLIGTRGWRLHIATVGVHGNPLSNFGNALLFFVLQPSVG